MFDCISRFRYEPQRWVTVTTVPYKKRDSWAPATDTPLTGQYLIPEQVLGYEAYTPNSSRDHTSFKDFQHYKVVSAGDSGGSGTRTTCWHNGWDHIVVVPSCYNAWWNGSQDQRYLPWMASVPDSLYEQRMYGEGYIVAPPSNHGELRQLALRSMMPGLKAQLSLLNSLYELKDMKTVPKTLRSIRQFFSLATGGKSLKQAIVSLLTPGGRKAYRAIAREQSKRASDVYLQTQFNVLPLISDIAGLYRAMRSTQAAIEKLLKNAGTPQLSRYRKSWLFSSQGVINGQGELVYDEISYPFGPTFSYVETEYSQIEAEYHATLKYSYTLTAYQVAHAQLLGTMDALGINLNPAIIWNAIPWSFVVDWVVGVNRWLDQFKRRNMEPSVTILDWCDSILYRRKFGGRKTVLSQFGKLTNRASMPTVVEEAYRRFTDFPSYSSFITSGLSPKEFSLGAALLNTRNWSKPRRR